MIEKALSRCPAHSSIRLSLECGLDERDCERREIEVTRNGIVFHSPWRFHEGALLSVAVTCPNCSLRRESREALVIGCEEEKGARGSYRVTLYFLCGTGGTPERMEGAVAEEPSFFIRA